jgi:adenylate cyclase
MQLQQERPLRIFRDRPVRPSLVAQHRSAAILAADVVGSTRLMCIDEHRTYEDYTAHRREFLDPTVMRHRGRIVKSTGDGFLVEFPSALNAVRCAVLVQRGIARRNQQVAADRRIVFRIGLSYGNIIADSDDIYGKEVNVAARLQALALPGGIAMSFTMVERTRGILELGLEDWGLQILRNIDPAVHTFHYRDPVCVQENC